MADNALGRIVAILITIVDKIMAGFATADFASTGFNENAADCGVSAYTVTMTACGDTLVLQLQALVTAGLGLVAQLVPALNVA